MKWKGGLSVSKTKVLIVSGPTASGKSDYAVQLAKQWNGEIISADSMQVFKGLDIGTAKITVDEQQGIPHHLLDVLYPDEAFSIARYQELARAAIGDIQSRGKTPIIAGGSGLYIQSLVYDYVFEKIEKLDFERYEKWSDDELYQMLKDVDTLASEKIEKNNRRRVMHALALAEQTEQSKTEREAAQEHQLMYDIFPIALMPERAVLYDRINQRVENMMRQGLLAEVDYFNQRYRLVEQVKQAIGYKEPLAYLEQKIINKQELIEITQQDTRKFAKRQMTWIKNQKIAYHPITNNEEQQVMDKLKNFMEKESL